ncbi:cyclic peptide export ABC transporter [Candidatus Thiothrix sp. Deng01]|uniref:Cyclic peptide export ABC transporter n=1 Tax=Candidatus Thiothrix phosphatis TaxID=3112415 RepID=A0ABU6CXM9_9GAMM|nr:cyclic peptide export ABC transporter [Candidatus Thiothrix sp. Deng01]MEB4591302.1 cyclic peptide export ABC transporter [Candidatus Thiothrix sp. Deng01]
MQLLKFLERETTESYLQVLLIATISGIANALLLGIVNHATAAVANNEDLTQYFLLYMITFALFLYGQWYAFERAILIIEQAIFKIRTRLTHKVQQVELAFMEKVGGNTLYGRLTQNDTLISQAVPQIVSAFQMLTLMLFSLLYLGYISPLSFTITLGAMGIGVLYFIAQARFIKQSLQDVNQKEKLYFKSISHLVEGFKEIKVNYAKGQDLLERIANVSTEAQQIKSSVRKNESRLWGFGRLFIYILLPIVVFILPSFSHEHIGNIFKISATLLFLTGPSTVLVNMIPMLNRVNLAIADLFALEEEMDAAIVHAHSSEDDATGMDFGGFQTLTIDNMQFAYPSANGESFTSGPFNEEVRRGELLFIIGGNGSGKSTFLKLLTGLYYPRQGGLLVDGTAVSHLHYPAYRKLFAIIFTDFHLFDKFYGVRNIDAQTVNYWLEKMHMQHKVRYQDGGFTNTSLSTGQRKRLAFIAAMLEDKPILVIDEFAADQDPQFRQYFYETLLGEVRDMGKTIIAVTHDDHYFHVADRVWKMNEGRIELHTSKQEE